MRQGANRCGRGAISGRSRTSWTVAVDGALEVFASGVSSFRADFRGVCGAAGGARGFGELAGRAPRERDAGLLGRILALSAGPWGDLRQLAPALGERREEPAQQAKLQAKSRNWSPSSMARGRGRNSRRPWGSRAEPISARPTSIRRSKPGSSRCPTPTSPTLAAHHAAVEQRQPEHHQQDQRGAHQHPADVAT